MLRAPRKPNRQSSVILIDSKVKRRLAFDKVQPLVCPAAVAAEVAVCTRRKRQPTMPPIIDDEDEEAIVPEQPVQQDLLQAHIRLQARPGRVSASSKAFTGAELCSLMLQCEE